MTASRSTHEERLYKQYQKSLTSKECFFCNISASHPQFVEETRYFKVIRNRFPYSIWDGQSVTGHLMVIPKLHVDGFGGLPPESSTEYTGLLAKYESDNYNVYARAPASAVKSVVHHHTHLLQLDGKKKKFVLLMTKPLYVRWSL